jgi:hypothetical protein
MAMVRICQIDDLIPIAQLAQWLAREGGTAPPKSSFASPVLARPTPSAAVRSEAEKKKLTTEINGDASQSKLNFAPENVQAIWQQLLSESGFAIQSDLRRANNAAISGPNALAIRVSRRYNAPGSLFQDAARLAKVEEILSRLVGQPCTIRIEWFDEAGESAAANASKSSTAVALGQQRQQRAELMQIPLVKLAADVLGAQIIRADDGFGAAAKQPDVETDTEETIPEDE